MPFKRPPELSLGQVWRRFRGREKDGKPATSYQICDLDPEDKEECLRMTVKSFLRDEPLCAALDILNDPSSVNTIVSNWSSFIDDRLTLACVTEDGTPAGHAICQIACTADEEDVDFDYIKGEQWKKLLRTLIATEESCDLFSHFGVDKYLSIHVMSVEPEHRGQNIGAEFFRAAENLAAALKIPVVATSCTATASQALAEKCAFTLISEFPYENMLKLGIDLSGCETKVAKVYGKRVC